MAAKPVTTVTATSPAGTGECHSNGRRPSPSGGAFRHERLPAKMGVIMSASSWFTQAAAGLLRTRWLVRAPVLLYRARLGILLGPRFVMLEHTGRKSGARRHVVLEVVQHPAAGSYVVVSGFGDRAQWFRNIRAEPRVRVYALSRKPAAAVARVLPPAEAAAVLADYTARHPRAWAAMEPVLRDTLGGSGDGESRLPVVALEPAAPAEGGHGSAAVPGGVTPAWWRSPAKMRREGCQDGRIGMWANGSSSCTRRVTTSWRP